MGRFFLCLKKNINWDLLKKWKVTRNPLITDQMARESCGWSNLGKRVRVMIGISLPFEKVKGIYTITFKIIRMLIVIRKVSFIMALSANEQYIVDEKGNPTAVILPIKEYKKMLSILEEVEDHKETRILSQSAEFKKLVKRGLEDIRAGRTKSWKEVWDDL